MSRRKKKEGSRLFNRKWVQTRSYDVDPKGMPEGYDTMIVADEFGNAGLDSSPDERIFRYALSKINRPDAYASITEYNRQVRGPEIQRREGLEKPVEIKASHDLNCPRWCQDITILGTKPVIVYLEKDRPPLGWIGADRAAIQRGVLKKGVEYCIRDSTGRVFLVIDHHSAYPKNLPDIIHDGLTTSDLVVDGDDFSSSQGQFSDVLQTHDQVAYAMHRLLKKNDDRASKHLKPVVRRIAEGDVIEKW